MSPGPPHTTHGLKPRPGPAAQPTALQLTAKVPARMHTVILATARWLCKASRARSKLKGQEVRDRRRGVGPEPQGRVCTLQGSRDTSRRSGPWVLNTTSQGLIQHLC